MRKLGHKRSMKQLRMLQEYGVEFYIGGKRATLEDMAANILRETTCYNTEFHFNEEGSLRSVCLVEKETDYKGDYIDTNPFPLIVDAGC